MKSAVKLVVVAAALLWVACQPKTVKNFSERADSLFATAPDFSGVVLVADHGKPIFYKAFGYRNFDNHTPLETTDVFELASVSKTFTSVLVMKLHQEGKLNIDDAIEKYLPGLPYPGITIRQLLNHTSGLPDYQAVMDEHWDKSKVAGNPEILEYLIRYHPPRLFEPGAQFTYSNTGYVLLGSIVEKVSGKDFVAYCHEVIFDPLGMTDTDLRSREQKDALPNFAYGYIFSEEKKNFIRADSFPASNYTIWLGARKGPGRVSSTARDLLKWDQALYGTRLLNAETLTAYLEPSGKPGTYDFQGHALGWMTDSDPTLGKLVRHSGDNPGYRTHVLRCVDQQRTIIMLCNNQHKQYKELLKNLQALVAASVNQSTAH